MCKSHCLPSCREPCGSEWGLRDTSSHTGKLLSLPVVSGAHPGSPGRPELRRSVLLSIQSSGVLRKMTSQNTELRFTPPEAHQNFTSVGWRRESYNYFLLFTFPFSNDHVNHETLFIMKNPNTLKYSNSPWNGILNSQFIKCTSKVFIRYKQVTSFTNRQSLSNLFLSTATVVLV